MLKKPELFQRGYHLTYFPVSDEIRTLVKEEKWNELDQEFKKLTAQDGRLYKYLQEFHAFAEIEFIISIRDSSNEWEEDGIWHDDGSRVFAFSLSLTLDEIKGGRLGLRERGQEIFTQIPTPSFGGIILFLTGIYGFEHKIHQVTSGRRVIIAGWCS
ncbi:MAG: 2OG-Fe(II) oxygenase [Bdellovibrionales bacterium]|nr:2OG-Fe(II) oxygenase [Bdellovibrionales bacterium]